MAEEIPTATVLGIGKSELKEKWLQDHIYKNPGCLDLGELVPVEKERLQPGGGRLDLLLKSDDDDSPAYYEVEVMLGGTDPDHIVRTLEYWDNERRRLPGVPHYAVLVAESITRRFFNVIQLLSQTVPMIAIQANLIEVKGQRAIHFTTVLNAYEGPVEPPGPQEVIGEETWRKEYPRTVQTAEALLKIIQPVYGQISPRYLKGYISLGPKENIYFWLLRRRGKKSRLGFWLSAGFLKEVVALLEQAGIDYDPPNRRGEIRLSVDDATITSNAETFKKVAELVKQSWEE
jgi:hypothetical protein